MDFWSSLKLMKGLYSNANGPSETSLIMAQKLPLSYKTPRDDLHELYMS